MRDINVIRLRKKMSLTRHRCVYDVHMRGKKKESLRAIKDDVSGSGLFPCSPFVTLTTSIVVNKNSNRNVSRNVLRVRRIASVLNSTLFCVSLDLLFLTF